MQSRVTPASAALGAAMASALEAASSPSATSSSATSHSSSSCSSEHHGHSHGRASNTAPSSSSTSSSPSSSSSSWLTCLVAFVDSVRDGTHDQFLEEYPRVVVAGVVTAFVIVYWNAVFVVCCGGGHGAAMILAHACLAPLVLCYVRLVRGDPGYVQSRWQQTYDPPDDITDDETRAQIQYLTDHCVNTTRDNSPYCQTCRSAKPLRAHHCRRCQRCVTRMDHHCAWINNCVGYNNLRCFIQFCFYLCVTSTFSLLILLNALASSKSSSSSTPVSWHLSWPQVLSVTISTVLCGGGVAMGAWNFRAAWLLACQNMTAIEQLTLGFQWDRAEHFGLKHEHTHQYDHGLWKNLKLIMGDGPVYMWLMPSTTVTIGDSQTNGHYFSPNKYALTLSVQHQKAIEDTVDAQFKAAGLASAASMLPS